MRLLTRPAVAITTAGTVILLGLLLAVVVDRGRDRSTLPDPATTAMATPARVAQVPLQVSGDARVRADGTTLLVVVPVRADVAAPVTLLAGPGLAGGLSAVDEEVRLEPGRVVDLRLRWVGPDCSSPVPDRVLPDLAFTARTPAGVRLPARLDTSVVDRMLRETWASGCGLQPTPTSPRRGS